MGTATDANRAWADGHAVAQHPLAHACAKAHPHQRPVLKKRATLDEPEPDGVPPMDDSELIHFWVQPADVGHLAAILREQINSDFDLLQDQLAYEGECDQHVVERLAYAMRLDARIARQRQAA